MWEWIEKIINQLAQERVKKMWPIDHEIFNEIKEEIRKNLEGVTERFYYEN